MFNSDPARPAAYPYPVPVQQPAVLLQSNAGYAVQPQRAGFEFGLFDIINAVWKRKWLIGLLALGAAGAATFYARTLPNTYESTAQLLIDPRELRVLDKDVLPQGFSSDASASYLESQARIITSTNMLRRIVEEQQLTDDIEFNKPPSALDRWLGLSNVPMDATLATAAALGKKLSVRRGEKTFVIDIAVETEDPDKSARLANAFVTAYLADQMDARSSVARRTSTSLTGRLEELQTKVREAEDKVEAYRRERNLVDANGKRVTEEQLAAINGQLSGARSRLADTKSKLEQIEKINIASSANATLPEAVNSPTLGILRQQLGDAERRAANLATTLGDRHPDFLSAIAVKRDAERAVQDEIGRIRAAARVEFQRATANEADISRQLDTLKKATLDTSADAVRLRELQREVDASRSLYQSFLQRSLETGEQEGIDSTNTRVITEAVPPLEKAGPNRKLLIGLAGFLAAGLGAALAVLLELISKFRAFQRMTSPTLVPATTAQLPMTVYPPAATAWPADPVPLYPRGYAPDRMSTRQDAEPDRQTYTELVRIMRRIEDIEAQIQHRRKQAVA